MYLCEEHNLSKSTDIHTIDWEGMDRSWVMQVLQVFGHEIERKTQTKLGSFKKAIGRI
jgi:hemolysin-activating ACP:hemolysin acyltransferase